MEGRLVGYRIVSQVEHNRLLKTVDECDLLHDTNLLNYVELR